MGEYVCIDTYRDSSRITGVRMPEARSTMEMALAIPLFVILIVGIQVLLHVGDKGRIENAARGKGWRDVNVTWAPFAPGWFFEKNERHYLVTYRDEQGRSRERYCKTSLLTGVFWRD